MEECILDKKQKDSLLTKDILTNLQWPSPENILLQLSEVIVFGTGAAAKSVTKVLEQYGVNILCYADNDIAKQQLLFHDKQVMAPEKLKKAPQLILIASLWAKDIAAQLRQLECKYLDFSFCVDFLRWKDHFNCEVFDVERAVNVGLNFLQGADLKNYLGYIRYRQTYDPMHLESSKHDHYLNPNVFPTSDDVYIDGGAWQGDTLLELKDLCGKNIEIHSFEPDEENYNILRSMIAKKHIPNCTVIKKALWDCNTTLKFVASAEAVHTMQARVSGDGLTDQKATEVIATTLDNYIQTIGRKPSYIKMDIEGAEPQALNGSAGLLKYCSPKLAISAYHEANHIWQLIEQINSINSSYKFWFEHHSQHLLESVLYAKADN